VKIVALNGLPDHAAIVATESGISASKAAIHLPSMLRRQMVTVRAARMTCHAAATACQSFAIAAALSRMTPLTLPPALLTAVRRGA
jgi:hypothetical protein